MWHLSSSLSDEYKCIPELGDCAVGQTTTSKRTPLTDFQHSIVFHDPEAGKNWLLMKQNHYF